MATGPGILRPHPKRSQSDQDSSLDRLLRSRPVSDPLNRGLSQAPRNLFELDNVNAFQADDGHVLAHHYRTGKYELQRRQITFYQKGVLIVSNTTPLDLEYSGILTKFRVRVGTVGTSSNVFNLKLNGSTVATVTLAAGATVAEVVLTSRIHVLCSADAAVLSLPADVLIAYATTVDGVAADLTGIIII